MSDSVVRRSRRLTPGLRVLVVDDSALMRKLITDLLHTDPGIQVVGSARDGLEAIEMVKSLKPDVITLDIHMPRMDGLTALRRIMAEQPTPVVILTGLDDHKIAVEALQSGAVDIVIKPSGPISADLHRIRDELIRKVKLAHLANIDNITTKSYEPRPGRTPPPRPKRLQLASRGIRTGIWAIVIGASTGGPRAVEYILTRLPEDIPATILVVQHMPPGFTASFAERLNNLCAVTVKEGAEGDMLQPGVAYIAPGGYHMRLRRSGASLGQIYLDQGPPENNVRPAADVTMRDAADLFGSRTLGVVLTGMGADGAKGLKYIKERSGTTIAQDRETSIVYGMPRAAAELGVVDMVLPLTEIPQAIIDVVVGNRRPKP